MSLRFFCVSKTTLVQTLELYRSANTTRAVSRCLETGTLRSFETVTVGTCLRLDLWRSVVLGLVLSCR